MKINLIIKISILNKIQEKNPLIKNSIIQKITRMKLSKD